MTSSTGCSEFGDWLMTFNTSEVAVWNRSASARSRVLACVSWNRRAFWIAIAA